jgi:spore maturation protein CgeB
MKVAIIGLYYLIECYESIATAFKSCGWSVSFFPYLRRLNHHKNTLENDIVAFIKGGAELLEISDSDGIVFAEDDGPADVTLWIGSIPTPEIFSMVRKINCINVIALLTDPLEYHFNAEVLGEILKDFHVVITNNHTSAANYRKLGCQAVYALPLGYDPIYHYPPKDAEMSQESCNEYKCDVSFTIRKTYLSEQPYKHTRRIDLAKRLIDGGILVKIFGPASLKEIFPDNYVRDVPLHQTRLVYANSSINISTHSSMEHDGYLNTRCHEVLASGGLLMVDSVKGLERQLNDGIDCIVINSADPVAQIRELLSNPLLQKRVRSRAVAKSHRYTWVVWVRKVVNIMGPFLKTRALATLKQDDDEKLSPESHEEAITRPYIPAKVVEREATQLLIAARYANTRPMHSHLAELGSIYKQTEFDINGLLQKIIE